MPYVFGRREASPRNAMALGPRELLSDQTLLSALSHISHDLTVELIEDVDDPAPDETAGYFDANVAGLFAGDQMSRLQVQTSRLARSVRNAVSADRLPLVANGGCTCTLGMVAGLGDVGDIGMVWFDAHDDAEIPETSTSGLVEGMPVSMIAGRCWQAFCRQIPGFEPIPADRILTIGLHEKYEHKPNRGQKSPGSIVNPAVIESKGYKAAIVDALADLRTRCSRLYVHVDVDVLDPTVLMSSHHAGEGGLSDVQLVWALDAIADRFEIVGLDFSSFDPTVDPNGISALVPLIVHAASAATRSRNRRE
ncbi:arginase family protein [Agrobacterium rhizogenes]|nr:arginase family protein [Rhizobium rhizogenes]